MEQIGFNLDHVHFVMIIPPKYSISEVVGQLKSQSAQLVRRKYQWLEKDYFKENVLWSPGYFVSSVGINEHIVKRYVEFQGQQDSGQLHLEL